jgi:hypothetical protein
MILNARFWNRKTLLMNLLGLLPQNQKLDRRKTETTEWIKVQAKLLSQA